MRLSKRESLLITAFFITLVVYAYYQFLYKAVAEIATALKYENEKLELRLREGETKKINQQERINTGFKTEEDYQLLLWKVPEDPCLPEIIAYLGDAAVHSQVRIRKVDYKYTKAKDAETLKDNEKGQTTAPAYDSALLELEADGTYYDLLAFVLKVENAPRLFLITGLTLESKTHNSDATAVSNSGTETTNASVTADGVFPAGEKKESEPAFFPSEILEDEPLNGSQKFDGNSISLKIKFKSFFDQTTAGSLTGQNEALVSKEYGKNPFI